MHKKYSFNAIYKSVRRQCGVILRKSRVTSRKIESFCGTKKGRRCFIVGNGPSLKIEDLNRIANEDSFAVNRIFNIYPQTNWRPTYYVTQDVRLFDDLKDGIDVIINNCEAAFVNCTVYKSVASRLRRSPKMNFFYINKENYYPELPKFSLTPNKFIFEGFSVAYACIQLAVYMGYSEIYIIGTDHSYNVNRKTDGTIEEDQTVTNYMPGLEGKLAWPPQMEKSTLAFRKARQVCDEKGIIIRNATRGGKLEEFERVDFDSLF